MIFIFKKGYSIKKIRYIKMGVVYLKYYILVLEIIYQSQIFIKHEKNKAILRNYFLFLTIDKSLFFMWTPLNILP